METQIEPTKLTEAELRQFSGTEQYHKHLFGSVYTDGVKYVADKAGAYWLVDAVFSHARKEPFQVWTLVVYDDRSACLEMAEDVGTPVRVSQFIPYTDFPLKAIKFYVADGVLMLPSEY